MADHFHALLFMWLITAFCLLFHENKTFWASLMIFWSLMLAVSEYFHSGPLLAAVWVFNAFLWCGSYRRHNRIKKLKDEEESNR